MVGQRHEHRVAAHQVHPLEGFRNAGPGLAQFLQDRPLLVHRDESAIAGLQGDASETEIDHLESGVLRNRAAAVRRGADEHVAPGVGGQHAAVGPARERDDLAHGNLALDATGPGLLDRVVVEVGIAAGLAGGVEIEQRRAHALERRQLEGRGEGTAERRERSAVGAPAEDGLVRVEVAVHAQPEMRRRSGRRR